MEKGREIMIEREKDRMLEGNEIDREGQGRYRLAEKVRERERERYFKSRTNIEKIIDKAKED